MYIKKYNHNYLVHHGVQGMHWGVRRYRNKDGTLTPLGKKKANTYATKYTKITGGDVRKHKNESSSVQSGKKISEMSNDELKAAKDRYKLETDYISARRENNKARKSETPPNKGVSGVASYWYEKSKKPVTDAYQDVLKETLKYYGKEFVGLPKNKDKDKNDNK